MARDTDTVGFAVAVMGPVCRTVTVIAVVGGREPWRGRGRRVTSLDVTHTRTGRGRAATLRVEQGFLLGALGALVVTLVFGFVPVTNPGVQSCGSPFVFSWQNRDDTVVPLAGSPSAPPNADHLRAQSPCHERVDDRLIVAGLSFVVAMVLGFVGAVLGLLDDRSSYRAAPPFETYLRERPAGAPADPWNRPVIPETDLGARLPDIEWREVRVVVSLGIAAVVVLAWLGPWSAVRHAIGRLSPVWLVASLLLVVVTYPIAAAAVLVATDDPSPRPRRFGPILATSIASSFTGRLLPEYGAAGLAVHHLVRSGLDRPTAMRRVAVVDTVAVAAHAVLVGVVGVVALTVGQRAGIEIRVEWLIWAGVVAVLVVGLIDAPRRYHTLVVKPDRRSVADLGAMLDDPVRLAGVTASCLALALVNGLVLVAAVHTFGANPALAPVLLVSLVASVAVVAGPTPDGAGLVEAVVVIGLVWAGVNGGVAVAAMVLARVLGFWLPMLPGWLVLRRLERNGTL
jgi:uncharacterized membrane protein YbhN (UPF0104 family)